MQEKGVAGDWMQIGYSAPGTGNSYSYASNVFAYTSAANAKTWQAAAKVKLNDCPATTGVWKLTAGENNSNLTITDGGTTPNCKLLTASWDNLTR